MPTVFIKADTKDATRNIKKLDKDVDTFARSSAQSLAKMERSFRTLKTLGIGLGGFFSAQIVAGYAKELVSVADTYTNINSRLKLVTSGAEEFNAAYDHLYDLSRDTGTTLDANSTAFTKLSNSMKGATSEDILGYLDTVNKSLVTSGASAEEASSFMLQFAQAMGSGVVAGDELKSMNEANSYLMSKVAQELGTNIAGLKKMGSEGELTAEKFAGALKKISGEVEDDFSQMGLTVDRAWNSLKQVFNRIISESDTAGGGTNALAEAIVNLADIAEENREEITAFLGGFVDKIPAAIEGAGDLATWIGSIGSAANEVVDSLDSKVGVGWKEIGLVGLIIWGAKKIPKIGGPLAIFGVVSALADALADKIAEANPEVENTTLLVTKLIDSILGGSDKIKAVDFALEGEFFDIDLFQNQLKAIDIMLDTAFSKIDVASEAEQAGKKAGAALVDGLGKEAKKEMEKLKTNLSKDIKDISEEIFDLSLEIETPGGSPTGAWDAIIEKANEYEEAAKRAISSGNWDEARKNVQDMLNYLNKLPDSVEGAAPTDAMIKRQKELVQYWLDMVQAQTSFHAKRQYLQNAQKEQEKLNTLLKEQKDGASEIISEEDARLQKMKELKEAQQLLLEIQKQSQTTAEETNKVGAFDTEGIDAAKKSLEDTKAVSEETKNSLVETGTKLVEVGGVWKNINDESKESLGEVETSVGDVKNAIDETGDAIVEIGGVWRNVTSDVISDLGRQTDAIFDSMKATEQYIKLLEEANRRATSLPKPSSSSGSSTQDPGFATGGVVPGFGGTDTVFARLTPGEGVLTPLGMGILGPAALSQLNVGQNPFSEKSPDMINLAFNFNRKTVGTLSGERRMAEKIIDQFANMRRALS